MAPQTPTRSQRKQQHIVEAAAQLFRRHGIRRVTVEEICRKAGVSKATFYKYHPHKMGLVKQILVALSDDALETLQSIEKMDLPFTQKVRLIIDDRLERTAQTSDTFIAELLHADVEMAAFIGELTERTRRRVAEFITEAQASGEVRPDIKLPFVMAMLGKLSELAADDALRRHYPDYTALTREIVDFFFYGLLPGGDGEPEATMPFTRK